MSMDTAEPEQEAEPRRRGGLFKFFGEVRAEGRKVTWATRQEVTVSTIMVLIMSVMASLFFFFVDTVLRLIVGWLLSLS